MCQFEEGVLYSADTQTGTLERRLLNHNAFLLQMEQYSR